MRNASRSGLELGRKTFSLVYVDDGVKADSTFAASLSEGFAQKLESEYFSGERVIGIYRLDGAKGADYAVKDTLLNLLMDTGTDVVFLLEAPELGTPVPGAPAKVMSGNDLPEDSTYIAEVTVPFTIRIDVYDSMNPADTVFSFTGRNTVRPVAYTDGLDTDAVLAEKGLAAIGEPARDVGRRVGDSFVSTWVNESHTFIYFDSSKWLEAAYASSDYRWKDAIDIWMGLLDTGSLQKRSCAEYNIALACYIMGQYDLASQWLDRSDKDYPISLSRSLRKNIASRQK